LAFAVDSSLLLFKTVAFGIPTGVEPRVEILSLSGDTTVFANQPYDLSRLAVSDLAVISRPIEVRGHSIVTVQVFPVHGGSIYREVEIELFFDGGTSAGYGSADPIFDRILSQTIVNYDQARDWTTRARPASKPSAVGPFSGGGDWYRLEISNTGLIKVTGDQLRSAGLAAGSVNSADLMLWAGEGLQLPMPLDSAAPDFAPVAVLIEDGDDGVFDRSDYILFYGEGIDRWVYPAGSEPYYASHRYSDYNVYWLNVAGDQPLSQGRITSVDGSVTGVVDTVINDYRRRIHSERDVMFAVEVDNRIYNYYDWYWTDGLSPEVHISTPNLIDDTQADVAVQVDLPTASSSLSLRVNGVTATEVSSSRTFWRYTSDRLNDNINEFQLSFTTNSTVLPYLDWINVEYDCHLVPEADRLDPAFVGGSGRGLIRIGDEFSETPLIFNIDNPRQPVRITGFVQSSDTLRFETDLVAEQPNHFYFSTLSRAIAPSDISKVSPTDLYTANEQIDYLIVTAPEFESTIARLATYRESQGLSVQVINVDDIYDNFSYGLLDPTAIRNFLRFTYESYPSPSPMAVLLVGDGHYDYRNHLGTDEPIYIPPYVNAYDTSDSYSDDNYVYFERYGWLDADSSYMLQDDRGVDMVTSRWPANTTTEVDRVIDKVLAYESATDLGDWRTKITLVADDEFSSDRDDETVHTQQTEDLQRDYIPRLFERDKIYLIEYDFVNGRKPAANDAIVNAFNEGRLLVNYVGHGSPYLWAHERIFTSADDIPRLNNGYKLPLVFAASCAIGFYDDPEGVSMAQQFLLHPDGGAIGVVSATRLVWSSLNRSFNQTVFEVMFGNPDMPIAQAVYTGKLIHLYGVSFPSLINNDRSYTFFGEPFVCLGRPQYDIEFTQAPDTLRPLRATTVSGRVADDAGSLLPVSGEIEIVVYDSDRMKTYVPSEHGGSGPSVTYSTNGAALYKGEVTVQDGLFEFSFVPPLDISYGGESARISAYGAFGNIDAAGLADSLPVSEAISEVSDDEGPQIAVGLSGRTSFTSGDYATATDTVVVVLDDPSGINLTGWLGHGITLVIDDQTEAMINLTPSFSYYADSYRSGGLMFGLDTLSAGHHTLHLKAWDNANNSSMVEFSVEITAGEQAVISDVLNYPNPMHEETQFSFYATEYLEKFSLEIYTLAGRKIKSFNLYSVDAGYRDDIVWRGDDETGDRVATGVYMFKATGQPASGREAAVVYGKVVVSN